MVGNGGGVVGGGGGSFDPSALAGYASQAWVEDNYISKLFFSRMFTANGTQKVYTSTDGGETWGTPVVTTVTIAPNEITPSETITDGETSGTKITNVIENVHLWHSPVFECARSEFKWRWCFGIGRPYGCCIEQSDQRSGSCLQCHKRKVGESDHRRRWWWRNSDKHHHWNRTHRWTYHHKWNHFDQ